MRILYVASEVAPFSETTAGAALVRVLPEQLQDAGEFESRILMPRYGVVSERRNRLHEVIRLSGEDIPVGDDSDVLKVKVASIPGIRIQVYFMDSVKYFKKKGIYKGKKDGKVFGDNVERALYFARATFATVRKLGWQPDIVHAVGWVAAFAPLLLKHELSDEALFRDAKSVFTTDATDHAFPLSAELLARLSVPGAEAYEGKDLRELGLAAADAVAYPEGVSGDRDGVVFSAEPEEIAQQAIALYTELLGSTVSS
ncbi:MAG: glycogen/starch synthase [Bacteroidota bacterium]